MIRVLILALVGIVMVVAATAEVDARFSQSYQSYDWAP